LTERAKEALDECQIIVGYKGYIKLLGKLAAKKDTISSGMTKEIERAAFAIENASQGRRVCLISSGDAGIYGMAGAALELLGNQKPPVSLEIIPGITAASSCASLLGAPLANDFAVISLSDLLTDKKLIKKRVEAAAKGDFVIVFYNPKSKKRTAPLEDAWRILMKHRSSATPVGIVRNAYRENEKVRIVELKDMLRSEIIDMFTTIIVGNSGTYVKGKYMVAPRGYKNQRF